MPVQRWTAYDGANAYAYADFDGSGTLTARYLDGPAVDFLLAKTDASGGTAWYLPDRLGSVRNLADTSGALTGTVAYDSYGKVLSSAGAGTAERFKFTGREYDAVTGLYDYRARTYDPATGRFISRDPIGFAGGDANLQRYVGNSPTSYTEPDGQVEIFGVPFVPPWDSRASWWPGDTAGAYYQATGGAIYHTGVGLQNRGGQILEGLNPAPIVSRLWDGPDGGYAQAYAADWEQAKRYDADFSGTIST